MKVLFLSVILVLTSGCDAATFFSKGIGGSKQKDLPLPAESVVVAIEDLENKTLEELREKYLQITQESAESNVSVPVSRLDEKPKSDSKIVAKIEEPLYEGSDVYIVLGSFKTNYFLEEAVSVAKANGYTPIIKDIVRNGQQLKTVKVGPMPKKEAHEKLPKLKELGFPQDSFVTH